MNATTPKSTVVDATAQKAVRELDRRTNDGFDVRLLWDPHTNRVFVTVADERQGDSFAVMVDGADALEAFQHPFAYTGNDYEPRSQPLERLLASWPRREEER